MPEALAAVLNGRSLADAVLFLIPLAVMPLLSLRHKSRWQQLGTSAFPRLRLYRAILVQQWLLVLCIALLWVSRTRPFAALGLDLPLTLEGKIGLWLLAAATPVFLVYRFLSLRNFDEGRREKFLAKLKSAAIAPRTKGEAVLFLPVAVTAGVSEELLYRGFLFWYLAPAMNGLAAAAFSAVLFGLAHLFQGWRSVLLTGAMGAGFGLFYLVSGSLWWVMGLHALNDLQFCIIGLFLAAWERQGKCG